MPPPGKFRSGTFVPFCQALALVAALFAASWLRGESDAPLHYYDSALGKTGAPLKAALQAIIRNHTVIPYTSSGTDTWDALKVLDQDPLDPNRVDLIYSGLTALKSEQYNGSTGTWDREHLWPQSFGITALSSNSRAKSDLFNLRPIDTNVNSARGNKYYDYSTAPISTHPEAPGSTNDSNSWEPRESDKGTIARSLFYMAVRYDGSDTDVPDLELSESPNAAQYRFGKLSALLDWNRQVGVTAAERQRNQTIYLTYQHNRNPFVDHPEYAAMVFTGLSPGQAWKETNFSAAELTDPAIGADTADPDGDGISNLLEYCFNRDPWQPESSSPLSENVINTSGSYSFTLIYPHNRNATDVSVSYESSIDCQTWTAASPQAVTSVVISSETEQVTARFAAFAPSYFRVRATRTSP